jgi:hypothetical protein
MASRLDSLTAAARERRAASGTQVEITEGVKSLSPTWRKLQGQISCAEII